MEWYEIVPQWITAIGTVLAVIVALFSKIIRDWYNRPIIDISCPNTNQCIEIITQGSESSDSVNEIRIRVKLENSGNYIANHAAIFIDTYYKKRSKDDSYIVNEFTPIQLRDYKKSMPNQIAPHLIYYFDVASVHMYDDMTEQDGGGKSKQFYKLYLLGAKINPKLGRGTYIIPLKFYSSRIKVKIAYLKIYWESDVFATDKEHFECAMLTKKEFNNIKIAK